MREPGYYWIHFQGVWQVAEWWNDNVWLCTGAGRSYPDSKVFRVREIRILSPDEVKEALKKKE